MTVFKRDDSRKKHLSLAKEIEDHLDRIFGSKNDELNKTLEARIKNLKEQADAKAAQHREEIYQAKKELRHFTATATELEERGEEIRAKIQHRQTQVLMGKKDILKMTDSIAQELAATRELDAQLAEIQKQADDRSRALRELIVERHEIDAKIPAVDVFKDRIPFDVAQEMEKLARIRALANGSTAAVLEELREKAETPAPADNDNILTLEPEIAPSLDPAILDKLNAAALNYEEIATVK
jgi:chromosome segregation ATPase